MSELPKGWVETILGEVIILVGGGTPKTTNENFWNGNIPWLSVVDFNDNYRWVSYTVKNITADGLNNSSTKLLEKGDLIISARGTVGALAQLSKKMAFNQSCYGIKEKNNVSNIDFLYYLIKDSLVKILGNTHGAVFDTITKLTFDNIQVKIPNIQEQKAIANVLSSFDNKIELLKEQNKTLETMAQTIFKEWLSADNNHKWEYKQIDEVLEISSSKRIFSNEYVENGIPFYRSKEIIELSKKPFISTELYISQARYKEIKENFSVPIKGDILLTSVGTLGVAYQIRDDKRFYFKDGNLTWFKKFSNLVTSDYIYLWLQLQTTQNQLNTISIGSTQKALTITGLKSLEIPILKDEEDAKQLFNILKINLNKINHNYLHMQTLSKIRDTLLPKLMSGNLRVKGFENE